MPEFPWWYKDLTKARHRKSLLTSGHEEYVLALLVIPFPVWSWIMLKHIFIYVNSLKSKHTWRDGLECSHYKRNMEVENSSDGFYKSTTAHSLQALHSLALWQHHLHSPTELLASFWANLCSSLYYFSVFRVRRTLEAAKRLETYPSISKGFWMMSTCKVSLLLIYSQRSHRLSLQTWSRRLSGFVDNHPEFRWSQMNRSKNLRKDHTEEEVTQPMPVISISRASRWIWCTKEPYYGFEILTCTISDAKLVNESLRIRGIIEGEIEGEVHTVVDGGVPVSLPGL